MKERRWVFFVLVWPFVMIAPVSMAQSNSSHAGDQGSVQELRSQLELLRDQMNRLQARLTELEVGAGAANSTNGTGAAQEGTNQTAQPPIQGQSSKQLGKATATY